MTEAKPAFPLDEDHYFSTPVASRKGHSTGDDVRAIQQALEVEVTGVYDEATREAVLAAQKKKKVDQTGVVDEATWKKIM